MSKQKPSFRIVGQGPLPTPKPQPADVKRKIKDIFPLLIQAHRSNCAWLKDFANDDIFITADLDEILIEFSRNFSDRKSA